VVEPADPRHGALEPEPEAGARARPVPTQVEVPLVGRPRQLLLLEFPLEVGEVPGALPAADDLPVPVGRDQVATERQIGPDRVGAEIERLDLQRETVDQDRAVVPRRDRVLLRRAEVLAPRDLGGRALQRRHGVVVGDAREGGLDGLELRDVALERDELRAAALDDARDRVRDDLLHHAHDLVEVAERDLRLEHPELGQVAPRLALLGAERRAEAVDLAERLGRRLHVELAGLREERRLAEVVDLEQVRRPLRGGGREDRRVDRGEAVPVEPLAERALDLGPDAEHRRRLAAAQVEVALLHQEADAVLLLAERELGDARADDGERRDGELDAARGARVGAHGPRHRDAALERDLVGRLELLVGDRALLDDRLDHARAVAQLEETELARGPAAEDPAGEDDGGAHALGQFADGVPTAGATGIDAGVTGGIAVGFAGGHRRLAIRGSGG
jgi:hypothetical protein